MRYLLWLATLCLLAIVFVIPAPIMAAETTINSTLPLSEISGSIEIGITTPVPAPGADIFSAFPVWVWVIFGVVLIIIIILAVFLLMPPSRKKKGQQAAKVDKQGKKAMPPEQERKMAPEGRPSPIAMPRPMMSQTPQPRAMGDQPMANRPMSAQPMSEQPFTARPTAAQPIPAQPMQTERQPRPVQPQPQPQAQPQPRPQAQPQVQPRPFSPQPGQVRPQPVKPQPVPRGGQPGMVRPQGMPQPGFTSTAPSSLGFMVNNLSIIPKQVKEDDPVTISATVINSGQEPGNYNIVFRINHVVEKISEMSLSPGASQTCTITVAKERAGEYFVEADGLTGTFAVIQRIPASFSINNLSVIPERVKQGQPVAISFMVHNSGERPGIYNAVLLLKGLAEVTEDIPLEPGETKSVTFNIVKDAAGFYPVAVEHLTGRFVIEMDWRE